MLKPDQGSAESKAVPERLPKKLSLDTRLALHRKRLQDSAIEAPKTKGKVVRMVGLTLEATGCHAAVGSRCLVESISGESIEAEVVGFGDGRLFLMAIGQIRGLAPGALVTPVKRTSEVAVGMSLLGRVIDGSGAVLDGGRALSLNEYMPLHGEPINPLGRSLINEPLDVGIRAINALLTIGRGQRMGLFAGSGVGKSTLLGLITRYSDADVVVVGLIGERGREVQEFIEEILGTEGMVRSIVVAAPADDSPLMRLHGAWRATAIAEYFRDLGLNVLLLMDSLTRVAQAQREIALAVGEPPVSKGYPPSVFTRLPQLVERAGNVAGAGSITAIYTVLVEGDDLMDPVADAARAILDGHICLTRRIADAGRYPAIDIEGSVSRVITRLLDPGQLALAKQFRELYSTYEHNRDLINIGAYTRGSDPRIDLAIETYPLLQSFLQQGLAEKVTYEQSFSQLQALSTSLQMAS